MSKPRIIETKIIGSLERPTKIRAKVGKVKVYRSIDASHLDETEGFKTTHLGAVHPDARANTQSYQLDERRWVHIPHEPTTGSVDTEDILAARSLSFQKLLKITRAISRTTPVSGDPVVDITPENIAKLHFTRNDPHGKFVEPPKEDKRTNGSKRAIEIESNIINGLAYFKNKRLKTTSIQYQLESGHIIQARWLCPTEDSESHCDLLLKVNGIDHRILGVFPETSKASIFNNICRAINFFGRGVTK